ncbi:MAG TPA: sigma-70 family RNA polymerase sigma factor [Blastocatellia bacterium]|nr:sigma-70 family RNA polymerase sigma factor [Blastocatellia bacterium]
MTEDELASWKRYDRNDETALEELVLHYLPLVRFWVNQISGTARWANRDDLMQEGIIGLIDAIRKFDRDREGEFRPYARKFVRGAVFRNPELSRNRTRYQGDLYRKVRDVHDKLMQQTGRRPTPEDIAVESGLSVKQVRNTLSARNIAFTEELFDAGEAPAAGRSTVERQDAEILIGEALAKLNEREASILTRHYWGDETDLEIAQNLGMTEGQVSKIRQRAVAKLRSLLGVEKRK